MRKISLNKHKLVIRRLREAKDVVRITRELGLRACAADPLGTCRIDSERAKALANYCGARRWVAHYRDILATSNPVKMANGHAFKVEEPA